MSFFIFRFSVKTLLSQRVFKDFPETYSLRGLFVKLLYTYIDRYTIQEKIQ